jgi:hypothetical protein
VYPLIYLLDSTCLMAQFVHKELKLVSKVTIEYEMPNFVDHSKLIDNGSNFGDAMIDS